MTARKIKDVLREYYLYKRAFLICTLEQEVTDGIADVLVFDKGLQCIEIEIKVTKPDFDSELKSIKLIMDGTKINTGKKWNKHYCYIKNYSMYRPTINRRPHRYYFCVPEAMKEYCLEQLKPTPYGLLVITDKNFLRDCVSIAKSSKVLHDVPTSPEFMRKVFQKLCFENMHLNHKLNLKNP